MNRSAILPEMERELKDLEDIRDRFISSVLNDSLPACQVREYKRGVTKCEKKINGLRFKIREMKSFIAHQTHQLNQKGKK